MSISRKVKVERKTLLSKGSVRYRCGLAPQWLGRERVANASREVTLALSENSRDAMDHLSRNIYNNLQQLSADAACPVSERPGRAAETADRAGDGI